MDTLLRDFYDQNETIILTTNPKKYLKSIYALNSPYLQYSPSHRRKRPQEYIPLCHMQLNIPLKRKLLYLSTWIFISSVYTFWVVLAAEEETVFFTPEPSHATAPVGSDFHGAAAAAGSAPLHSRACCSNICGIRRGM